MVNISPFDLTDYQIFDSVKKENYENQDCCFLHALKISGKVSDIKMNELRATVKCKVLPKYLLKKLCESLDVFVSVQVPDGGTHKKRWYPNTPTKDEKKQDAKESMFDDIIDEMINEEVEVEQAEVVMALRALADDVQDHVERVGRMINEDLPAILDQMKSEFGAEQAVQMKQTMEQTLTAVLDRTKQVKMDLTELLLD